MKAASLMRWETMLAAVLIAAFVVFSMLSPYFLSVDTLSDATFNFTERAIVALPLALLIIAGEIDISVAAIIALSSVAMGLASAHGVGTAGLVAIGLGTGLLAGCVNGALVTIGRVPSIVATIGTMTLFRGAAYAVLGDRVLKDYPDSFAIFGQGYLVGPISIELALFTLFAILFGVFLHRTRWGRVTFAVGANPVASRYSGIAVNRYRFALFALTGLFSGVAAVLLTSRLGSTRPSIAQGWELEIISMVILGGVSVWGGKGSIVGVVLAALVFGLTTFGLGLMNIPGIVLSIFTGPPADPRRCRTCFGESPMSTHDSADRRFRRGQDQCEAHADRSGAWPGDLEHAPRQQHRARPRLPRTRHRRHRSVAARVAAQCTGARAHRGHRADRARGRGRARRSRGRSGGRARL